MPVSGDFGANKKGFPAQLIVIPNANLYVIEPNASQNCYISIRNEITVMICFSLLHRARNVIICGFVSSFPEQTNITGWLIGI
jgi:hypothetical protein